MKYCPKCGNKLSIEYVNDKEIMTCVCGFIHWDNWVYVSSVSICYNDQNDILMVKMKRTHEGKWTFPGGYRELNETLEQACIRECKEETGYDIGHLTLYKTYTKDDSRLVWIVYKAKILSGSFIPNDEVSTVRFFKPDNLPLLHELRGPLTEKLVEDLKNEALYGH